MTESLLRQSISFSKPLKEQYIKNAIKAYQILYKALLDEEKYKNRLINKDIKHYSLKLLYKLIFILYIGELVNDKKFCNINGGVLTFKEFKAAIQEKKEFHIEIPKNSYQMYSEIKEFLESFEIYDQCYLLDSELIGILSNQKIIAVLELLIRINNKGKSIIIDYSQFPVKLLGEIYENIIQKDEKRKKRGTYYSPDSLTKLITEKTLTLIIKKLETNKKSIRKNLSDEILEIKILDPAAGSGYFIIDTLEYLTDYLFRFEALSNNLQKNHNLKHQIRRKIIKNCLYAVNLNEVELMISKISLLLTVKEPWHSILDINQNFKLGNSILDFNFKRSFPKVFDQKSRGFDLIIGNPPWGIKIHEEERRILEKIYPQVNDYESFQYFSCLAINLLKENGYLSFIVPNTFALNVLAKPFRTWILDQGNLIQLIDYSSIDLFADPNVRSLIFIFKKAKTTENCRIRVYSDEISFSESQVSQLNLKKARTWSRFFRLKSSTDEILNKIEAKSINLNEITESKQGYIPYRLTTLIKRFGKENALKIRDNREWHSNIKLDKDYRREIKGGDINRYNVNWSGTWIKYGEWVSTHIDLKYFTGPRLLFREIIGSNPYNLIVAYSSEEYINNPSIISAILRKKSNLFPSYSLLTALAILNSSLISFYFKSTAPKARKGLFPKIIVSDVRKLPIYHFSLNSDQFEEGLFCKELGEILIKTLKQEDYKALNMRLKELWTDKHHLVIHDFLKYLSIQTIKKEAQKQRQIRCFKKYLSNILEIELDVLNKKKKLNKFYQQDFNNFKKTIQQIEKKSRITNKDQSIWENIKSKFNLKTKHLNKKLNEITTFNEIIDNIIFMIYGISETEIREIKQY